MNNSLIAQITQMNKHFLGSKRPEGHTEAEMHLDVDSEGKERKKR